ncbi:MAG: tetratricopeptide repeat protein [Anaerolineae bacterium]|nr:tetratricopeptide repeat protein [Anaerolineae bacterium]
MHRVFISSTSKDLHTHREAVRDAVLKLGMHPVMMEHFPAMDADAIEACRRKVLDCDEFVGIYAHRYGYTPTGYTQSITELEYEWAAHLPRHLFVVKPDYAWPAEFTDGPDEHAQLEAFKARVGTGHVWSEFTTPDSLAAAVTQSLVHDAERLSREQSRQRRLFIGGILTVAVLIVATIAAILLTKPDEEKIGTSQANREATQLVESTLNAEATQTIIALTPTPLEGQPAEKGETLLLIADFTRIDTDATNIEPNLEREFEDAGIHYLRIHHSISSREQAREILRTYNAALILWGEAARGGVAVQFEAAEAAVANSPLGFGQLSVSAADVPSFDAFVFAGMDTRYIVEFTLGRIRWSALDAEGALDAYARAERLIPEGREHDVHAESLHLMQGMAFEDVGQSKEAIAEYQAAAEIVPEWGFPYVLMAVLYFKNDDLASSRQAIEQAFERTFDKEGVYAANAVYFEATARITRVTMETFNAYVQPDAVDYATATTDLDWIIQRQAFLVETYPMFPIVQLYLLRAALHSAQGDYTAALADYDEALALEPTNAFTYYSRALTATIAGKYEAALADVNHAIELNNTDTTFYDLRGQILNYTGEYEAALADYGHALELDPTQAKLYSGRGSVYSSLEDYEAALADYNHAIELDPANATFLRYRADLYMDKGDYAAAITDYNTLLSADPLPALIQVPAVRAEVYANRGYCYLEQGQFATAIEDYTAAIELNPIPSNYLMRGNAAMFSGDVASAQVDFATVLELEPDYLAVYIELVYLYALVPGNENCEMAQLNLAKYQELGGDDPDIADWAQQGCLRSTPSPTPQPVTDAVFDDGTVITLPSPRPTTLISEPLVGMAVAFCTPGTEATVLQTSQIANGTRWVQLECDGGTGWLEEDDLPMP